MTKGKRLQPEQIITLLRQIDVLTTNGKTLAQACKEVGAVEQSYYRWRKMYGRYGYRMIAGLMRNAGWGQARPSKVGRIWREEGLKVPQKQPPRGRLWLNDGSCIRLRASHPNPVWSYDFVFIRDAYGGKIRMLTMIDEFSRRCLAIHCARRIGSIQVIEQLAHAMILYGIPQYIRSDNGPEFIAKELRCWLQGAGVKTAYIESGSPWENGYCESFNGTFRDELLDGEIFYSLKEAQIVVGQWVKHYNQTRPHSSLGYRPPAPQAKVPRIIQNQPGLLQ